MKRTYLFSLLATLAISNTWAASMQQSPSQVPLGEGAPVENKLSLAQNDEAEPTNSKNGQIESQSAGGELQTTIIDSNGNLKIVPKNSPQADAKPGVTSPGMTTTAPNNAGSPRMPTQVNPNNVTPPTNPSVPANQPSTVSPPNSSIRQPQQSVTAPPASSLPTMQNQPNMSTNQQPGAAGVPSVPNTMMPSTMTPATPATPAAPPAPATK